MKFKNFSSLINLILFFWEKLHSRRKFQIVLVIILNFFSALIEIISMASIMPFITAITNPEKLSKNKLFINFFAPFFYGHDLIFSITVLFIVLNIFSAVIRYISSYLTIRIIFISGSDIGQELYKVTLLQDYEYFTLKNSSELISIIGSKAGTIITNGVTPVLHIINNFILYIILLTSLVYVNYKVTIFTILVFGAIYGLIIFFIKPIIKREGIIVSQSSDITIKVLQESFGGIREIIFNNSQFQHILKYSENERALRNAQSKSGIIMNFPKFIVEPLGMIILALIAYYLFINSNQINPLAELVLITLAFQRLLPIMQQLFSHWSTLINSMSALEDVMMLMSLKPRYITGVSSDRYYWNKSIEAKGLFFKYKNRANYILEDINFSVKKGAIIGFVGKSGSGKSTLIDIISGLIRPTKGQIIIDGESLDSEIKLSNWRNEIAVVSQRTFLLDCSLVENIAFGVEESEINMNRVLESIKLADLDSTVSSLPDGLETTLGERGVQLSGGQLQRIGIARAFYKNASVLILDEFTSSLDTDTENEILKSLYRIKDKFTIFMIAHKISTLELCDVIYEVKNSRIVIK